MKYLTKTRVLFAALLIFLFSFSNVTAQTHTARYASMTANTAAYYEYLPQGYSSGSQTYAVLIYLHGIAELGAGTSSTLPKVLANGPPYWINKGGFPTSFTVNGVAQKMIIISPQFKANPSPNDVTGIIAYLKSHYRVDAGRIYLTGISMGGATVWNFAGGSSTNANQLAAIIPICAAVASNTTKAKIMASANLPVWGIHNQYDGVVPYTYTVNWVNAINASAPAPNPLAKKTIFPVTGHNAWYKTYNPAYRDGNKSLYEWLLTYRRGSAPAPPANKAPVANAGADKAITLPTNSVALAGSATDADGTISRYSWTKAAGPTQYTISNAGISNPVVSNLVAGTYTLRLTVTDNKGATAYNDMNIVVNSSTQTPAIVKAIPGKVEAESYDAMYGVQKAATTDAGGGSCVGYINKGDWFDYKTNVTTAGYYTVSLRVSAATTGAQFYLRKSDGTNLAVINVPKTGANQTWTTTMTTVNLPAGNQTIRVVSNSTASWNINWIQFAGQNTKKIPGTIQAENYDAMAGIQKAATSDAGGGSCIGYVAKGDWFEYKVYTSSPGNYSVSFRVSSLNTGSQFSIRKANGTTLATINVPRTGGNQTWTTVKATVNLPAGNETLRIVSNTSGANNSSSWNINWLQFAEATATNSIITGEPVETQQAGIETNKDALAESVLSDKSSVRVFPNPVVNTFTLQLNNGQTGAMKVQVIDMMGRVRKEYSLTKNQQNTQLSLSASELSAGTYFIRIQIGKWTDSQKIMKL